MSTSLLILLSERASQVAVTGGRCAPIRVAAEVAGRVYVAEGTDAEHVAAQLLGAIAQRPPDAEPAVAARAARTAPTRRQGKPSPREARSGRRSRARRRVAANV